MSVQAEIRIGSEFVGYRIDELIGRGGMGVVYRAYDLRLKRTVALKLMAPELALDQRFRERFAREAELAMSLEHPNVVPIHDAGDIDGRLYLAMRYVEGTDLRALLRAEGALDPARALAICSQVANALDAAHANGLVHRDVKPSNVLLDANEHVYLADFGLTRRLDEQGGPAGEGRSVGTPAYLAPEQIEGGSVDGRTDVYSLGCLLYECLTGETPFARGSRLAVAWAHLEEEPPRASERRPELPEAIDAVIRKAMAKEPADRYATCAALIDAAEEALELRPPALLRHRRAVIAAVASSLARRCGAARRSARSRRAATPPGRADRHGEHARPHRSCDEQGRCGHRRRLAHLLRPQSAGAASGSTTKTARPSPRSTRQRKPSVHTTTLVAYPAGPPARSTDRCSPPTRAARGSSASDQRGRSYLTRVFSGPRGKREYRLEQEPRAVAVGYGAVWVVHRGARDNERAAHRPELPARSRSGRGSPRSAPIDSLTAGLGSVWVCRSSSGVLYRIDPRSARVTGRSRPCRSASLGPRWCSAPSGSGRPTAEGDTVIIDPRTVRFTADLGCCAPTRRLRHGGVRLDLDVRLTDRDRRAVGRY